MLAAAALPASPALAAPPPRASEPGVTIQHAWLRVLIASRPAAGYFTLRNDGTARVVLTGASSPACDSVMLHQSVQSGGQDRMTMVKQVVVPPRRAVSFSPGGLHLMCMSPKPVMLPGTTVDMTLDFAGGGTLTVPFAVTGASGQ